MSEEKNLHGAVPDHELLQMIKEGCISGAKQKHVNPASLNLPLSEEVWRIERFYLPQQGERIESLIRGAFCGRPHSFSHPLERGIKYLIRLKTKLHINPKMYGFCNPRSTTGRTFLSVSVVCDGVPRYDSVPKGWTGDMWVLVNNDIFSCLLLEDDELVQLRLFHSDTRLNQGELDEQYQSVPLLFDHTGTPIDCRGLPISDNDGSLLMTLSIPNAGVTQGAPAAGWKTKFTDKPVKFSKENYAYDFYERITSYDGTLDLDSRTGLILATKEILYVPSDMAAEGVRVDDRAGRWDSHRAGYFDPGFKGSITLEIAGSGETIRDGTSALKVKYERLSSSAQSPYAKGYSGQIGALLGKNFLDKVRRGDDWELEPFVPA